jgi:hypothetical protein
VTRVRRWRAHPTGICGVAGCTAPHVAAGLCERHRKRSERTGTLNAGNYPALVANTRRRLASLGRFALDETTRAGAFVAISGATVEHVSRRVWRRLRRDGDVTARGARWEVRA